MKFEVSERDYLTIREAARLLHISHDRIRAWQREGLVPGFFSGSRFYVNLPRFKAKLEAGEIGAQPQRSGDTDGEDGGSGGGRFCGGEQPRPGESGRGSIGVLGRG